MKFRRTGDWDEHPVFRGISEGFSTLCFTWLSCKLSVSIFSGIAEALRIATSILNLFPELLLSSLAVVRQHDSSLDGK